MAQLSKNVLERAMISARDVALKSLTNIDLDDNEIRELAVVIKKFLPAMIESLEDPSYNIIVNSSPVNLPGVNGYHWFMEINPRLMIQNGMEASCGYYINPVAPEFAARTLKESLKTQEQQMNGGV